VAETTLMIGLLAINKDNLTAGNYLLKRFEACLGSLAEQISAHPIVTGKQKCRH